MPPLRINLLPAYIAERKKTQGAIALFAVILIAAIVAPLLLFFKVQSDVKAMTDEANQVETEAAKLDTLTAEASKERSQIAPLQDKVDFVEAANFYNGWRQKIYRRAAQYTYSKVEYNSMAVQANTLSINAYATNIDDLGRYLITFFGNPDVEAVSISGPPGWNPQQLQPIQLGQLPARSGFPFTVTARLIKSIQLPQLPTSLGAGAAGAPGGAPAFGGGAPPPVAAPPDAGGGAPPDAGR